MALPRIAAGDPIRAVHLQDICREIEQNRIRPGPGLRAFVTSGGTTLAIDTVISRGGGTATTVLNPFQVVSGYTVGGIVKIRVSGESYISAIETGQLFPISGLGAIIGSAEDNENDPGLFDFPQIGESIWLEMTLDGFEVTSISVWTGKAGEVGWENYPDPVEYSQATQEDPIIKPIKVYCLIAHVVGAEDPRSGETFSLPISETETEQRKILQQLRTNLGIQTLLMRGVPVPMLVPWHGPFIIE